MRVIALIAIVATAGSPALAQPAPTTPEPITVTGVKSAPPPKMVCKFISTGTMIQKRVCMPKSEWAKVETSSHDSLKEMRDWQRVRCGYGMAC